MRITSLLPPVALLVLAFVPIAVLADAPAVPAAPRAMPEPYAGHIPFPPWNENGRLGHEQMVAKAKVGRIDLYFLGDSITRRWGATDYPDFLANFNRHFHGWNAADFGWGGDSTHQILWRILNGEFDGLHPKVIVLLAGTNNIGRGERPGCAEDTVQGIKAILTCLREKSPESTILLTAIFPRNDNPNANPLILQANAEIAKLADGKKVRLIDINAQLAGKDGTLFEGVTVDHLHLSEKGYDIWAAALEPVLTELLGPRAEVDLAPPPTGDPSASKNKDLAPDLIRAEKPAATAPAPAK